MTISVCKEEGCDGPVVGQGWCRKHYMRVRRWGTPEDIDHRSLKVRSTCTAEDCGKPAVGRGLCNQHYQASRYVPKAPRGRAQRIDRTARPSVRRELHEMPCAFCATPFLPRDPRNRFCSSKCKSAQRTADGRNAKDVRKSRLKLKYGLTPEEMDKVVREGSCEICGTREWGGRHGVPHVDHCHATGAVRGFLCNDCNHGLGRFHDDPQRMEAAAAYVRLHQERIGRGETHVIPVRPYWE